MMERRQVRALLYRWGHIRDVIRSIEDIVKETEAVYLDALNTLKSMEVTGMPGGSGVSDPVEEAVQRMEQEQAKLDAAKRAGSARIEAATAFHDTMNEIILDLPVMQQRIVRMRYQDDRPWRFIAEAMYCSEKMVRLHDEWAVDSIGKQVYRSLP